MRLVRILQMGLDVRVLSISRLSACVGHLAAAKSVRSFRSIGQRTHLLKSYRGEGLAPPPILNVRFRQYMLTPVQTMETKDHPYEVKSR